MQNDLTHKQAYVYQQINQLGYNSKLFQEFLIEMDPMAGINLDLWQTNTLQMAIKKFKMLQDNKKIIQGQRPTIIGPLTEIPLSSDLKNQTFMRIVACQKLPITQYFKSQCLIAIDRYFKKQGGVFSKGYYLFEVKIRGHPNKQLIRVQRRYSDFEWLRDNLLALHPAMAIPLLPSKGKMKKDYEKHITKRMQLLEKFLIKVNSIPELKLEPIMEQFLFIEQYHQFQKFKFQYKVPKNPPLNQLCNLTGEMKLLLSQDTCSFVRQSQVFLGSAQPKIKQVYKNFKGVAAQLENSANLLKNAAANCQNIETSHRQLFLNFGLLQKSENIYSVMKKIANSYAGVLIEEAQIIRRHIHSLLKFQSIHMLGLLESISRLSTIQKTYFSNKANLFKKKQKLFQDATMNKWQLTEKVSVRPDTKQQAFSIMLPKQTTILLEQRERYAYYNYQVYEELVRYFKENEIYLIGHIEGINELEMKVTEKRCKVWEQIKDSSHGLTVT